MTEPNAQPERSTIRCEEFFIVEAGLPINLHMKVEDEFFAIPTEVLRRRSLTFKELTDVIRGTQSGEGSSDQQAISLDTGLSDAHPRVVRKEEFRTLCRYLMGGLESGHDVYSIEELEHLLKLATIWHIPEAREFAVRSLDKVLSLSRTEDAAQRFRMAYLYQVSSWFLPAFKSIAGQQFLTKRQMEILGTSWIADFLQVQEEWLYHRRTLVFRYQKSDNFPMEMPVCLEEPSCKSLWPYVWERFVARLTASDQCAPDEETMKKMLDEDYYQAQQVEQAPCEKCYAAIGEMMSLEGILGREAMAVHGEAMAQFALQSFPPEWSDEQEKLSMDWPASGWAS
ncbi:hypothetical protein EUX98_g8142 [Antrodiella citrinella]|uniref:BTB domain-containing protein n=1 Tax=Antrodiella citrinella TaxID=2447956 RepID=A0A4S4MCL4_9APHY|nr:hypothetical protein EUX98_g8142 [Antrodiella citrinella]